MRKSNATEIVLGDINKQIEIDEKFENMKDADEKKDEEQPHELFKRICQHWFPIVKGSDNVVTDEGALIYEVLVEDVGVEELGDAQEAIKELAHVTDVFLDNKDIFPKNWTEQKRKRMAIKFFQKLDGQEAEDIYEEMQVPNAKEMGKKDDNRDSKAGKMNTHGVTMHGKGSSTRNVTAKKVDGPKSQDSDRYKYVPAKDFLQKDIETWLSSEIFGKVAAYVRYQETLTPDVIKAVLGLTNKTKQAIRYMVTEVIDRCANPPNPKRQKSDAAVLVKRIKEHKPQKEKE